ncbi:spore-associated protein [Kitasatospora fiedleri]|uniref:spore-associated protein n=1 Tax=Kitasatospora fiedleri TaxID=2991545 RepID=UPI00249A580D|nr:spore-associated protein [Kitasatospora fiedleri]
MKKLLKRAALTTAVTALAATGVAVTPSVAQAATYNGVCGSGYGVIDTLPLLDGTVFLTYNSSNGYNCVVTVRNHPSSYLLEMEASIKKSGTTQWKQDLDFYTTYAGPVYLYAPGTCIDWQGGINGEINNQLHSHCS